MGGVFLKGGSLPCGLVPLPGVASGPFGVGASVSLGWCAAASAVGRAEGGGVYRISVPCSDTCSNSLSVHREETSTRALFCDGQHVSRR